MNRDNLIIFVDSDGYYYECITISSFFRKKINTKKIIDIIINLTNQISPTSSSITISEFYNKRYNSFFQNTEITQSSNKTKLLNNRTV